MLAIVGGRVYTCNNNEVLEEATVLINEGKFLEVGYNVNIPKDAIIIDATGLNVYPGFVDPHSHIGLAEEAIGFFGEDENERSGPVQPELRAIDGINPMDPQFESALQSGVTTVVTGPGSANVLGGTFLAMKTVGRRVDDMVLKDPVAMKVAFGENPKKVYGQLRDTAPTTRMGIMALLRGAFFEARQYMARKELDNVKYDMRNESLIPVLKREIPIKVHAHRADDIFSALRLKKEFNLDITLDHCTEGHFIVEELLKENVPCIVGPNLTGKTKSEVKNKSYETAGILAKAGVKVAIMTDAMMIPQDQLPLCAAIAIKAGMDKYDALNSVTINAAEITGVGDRVGSIEVGKDADVVLVKGDILAEIDTKVVYTIINGNVVYSEDKK